MEIDAQFETAVEKSTKLAYPPSNERLLRMYGLHKQATEGDCNLEVAHPEDLVERAKHDAWAENAGMSAEEAKKQYVELIDYLANKSKQTVLS